MKKNLKIALNTIILTSVVSYLTQYWFKHSGLEDKALNKLDDIKDIHVEKDPLVKQAEYLEKVKQ